MKKIGIPPTCDDASPDLRGILAASAVVAYLGFSSLLLPTTVVAQAFSCDELRPIRGTDVSVEGDVSGEVAVISKRLFGGEVNISGDVRLKELFPEVFAGADLYDTERFYYAFCLVLADERLDPERRFSMFMLATRDRRQTLREVFHKQITSDDPDQKIDAIQWGVEQGPGVRSQAIEAGLQSESGAVKAAAIEGVLGSSKVISGAITVGKENQAAAFSVVVESRTEESGSLNFTGKFEGGIFWDDAHFEIAQGNLRGETLSVTNRSCSLVASVSNENTRYLRGTLTCNPGVKASVMPYIFQTAAAQIQLY